METYHSKDWIALSSQLKQSGGYRCDRCNVQCLRPGELRSSVFQLTISGDAQPIVDRSQSYRLRLQTHHKDRNPQNNDPSNLENLCPACHLAEHRGDRKRECDGQLSLF